MQEPTLVILAAGMGSRFGGLKQITAVDDHGHAIIDFSLYDAYRAGFRKVVFIIKHEIEEDFKNRVGRRMEKYFDVKYVYQQLDVLPAGYAVPEGRVKPWGTGHAVLCCAGLIDAPFAVINADDYYGPSAFQTAYDSLIRLTDDDKQRFMMVGYHLRNTLTDNGHVARGVCEVDKDGYLLSVTERTHIISSCDGALYTEDGQTYRLLPEDALVSMNMWGFTPSFVRSLQEGFPAFLEKAVRENPLKAEYFLPSVVSALLDRNAATVQVLPSHDRWYGVTYKEDKPVVVAALRRLAEEGLYPTPLWG